MRTILFTIYSAILMLFASCTQYSEADVVMDLSVNNIEMSCEGGSQTINVTLPCECLVESSQSWLQVAEPTLKAGKSSFTVQISENISISAREAELSIYNTVYNVNKTITVHQGESVPFIKVKTDNVTIANDDDACEISIVSNVDYDIAIDEDWCQAPFTSTGGKDVLLVDVLVNDSKNDRQATITLSNKEYDLSEKITITQKAFVPIFEIDPESLLFSAKGGVRDIEISSNFEYEMELKSDWSSFERSEKGILLSVEASDVTVARKANIKIFSDKYEYSKTIIISQEAFVPHFVVEDIKSLELDYTRGSQLIAVESNFEYNVSTDADWIVLEKLENGVVLKYSDNLDMENSRSAKVIISSELYNKPNVEISVTQAALPNGNILRYTTSDDAILTPYNVDAFGGAKIVSITNENGNGEIKFDSPITTIGENAFYEQTRLTGIVVGGTVTSIGANAFYGCTNLKEVTIAESVTSIGQYAFRNCDNLTGVYISDLSAWCKINYYSNSSNPLCNGAALCLHNSVVSELTIPSDIEVLNSYAFQGCASITSVTIPNNITSIGYMAFYNCSNLDSVYCEPTTPPVCGSYAFDHNASDRKIYVPLDCVANYKYSSEWSSYEYSIEEVPYTPIECTSLTITAEDVEWNATYTTITFEAVTNGETVFGPAYDRIVTGTVQSEPFLENESETAVQHTISFEYLGKTAETTITQGAYSPKKYTVNLNEEWRLSSSISNPDSSTYDGVYESNSNYNVHNSYATMYIDITGYTEFSIYVRSYTSSEESKYDYVMVSQLDTNITGTTSYSDATYVKAHTRGVSSSTTSISGYTKVTYSNISSGSHRITIVYRKDSSYTEGADRGYVLIPKNQ